MEAGVVLSTSDQRKRLSVHQYMKLRLESTKVDTWSGLIIQFFIYDLVTWTGTEVTQLNYTRDIQSIPSLN